MVKASLFLFGYRRLLIDPSDMPSVCVALMHRGVALQQISKEELLIPERAVSHIEAVCDGKIEYSLSEPMGIFGIIKRIKYKRGIIVGIIISLLLTVFLQNLVWDIRIDGAVKKSEQEIKDLLASCGLEIGSSWHSLDRAFIEAEVLASKSGISWININKR